MLDKTLDLDKIITAEPIELPAAHNLYEFMKSLEDNYKAMGFPESAIEWLIMIWRIAQFFDDVADGDPVERLDLNAVLWDCLIGMNQNTFYQNHIPTLCPLVANAILKWQGSDNMERKGGSNAVSFVWRAGYYDLVLMVYFLVHGHKKASEDADLIASLYGESYDEYLKEFNHA
ncbi:MAG: hypothetical protein GY774_36200 [Planctomycetes bacterium]|nr:hypothetical protein [Planctomycetota bacterium]